MAINLIEAFEKEPEELDFVLPGLIRGTIGILTSAGGVGKSFWMLEAAMSVASHAVDKRLLKLDIEKNGTAIILNAEDHTNVLTRRLHQIGKLLDEDQQHELARNLIIEPLFGKNTDIMQMKWQDAITRLVSDNKARLLVLDTLSRWHKSDENSNEAMGKLMSVLDSIAHKTNCAIVLLHHVSKSMAMNGRQDEQQSVRGASLLVDNARWQSYMASMSKEEAAKYKIDESCRKLYVKFGISKQNNDRPFNEMWMKRHEGGVLLPVILACDITDFKDYKSRKRGVLHE